MDTQRQFPRTFSFEFYPPRTAKGEAALKRARAGLARLAPDFFSVTFGAGGSTQTGTLETVVAIHRDTGLKGVPHVSCISSTRQSMRRLLRTYIDAGVHDIVALRGDLPPGRTEAGELRYANELVAFIREETGSHFHIEVAAYPEYHPQAPSPDADLDNFKRKVEAGADAAMTQYFFNADAYFRFIERCEARSLQVPVVPGIMPIVNYPQLARFSDACGAEIPRWIRKRLEAYQGDDASLHAFGIDVVTRLCERLLDGGAPGLHFYTLNRAEPTTSIWRNLGLGAQRRGRREA